MPISQSCVTGSAYCLFLTLACKDSQVELVHPPRQSSDSLLQTVYLLPKLACLFVFFSVFKSSSLEQKFSIWGTLSVLSTAEMLRLYCLAAQVFNK
jgi:hypothetical protein